MAFSPLGRSRRLRRIDLGPAAVSRGVDTRLPRRVALALTEARYILSKEFSEALWHLRAELRAELRQEQDARRAHAAEFIRRRDDAADERTRSARRR